MMHRNDERRGITPGFVDDGGYFPNPADGTLIGWVRDPVEHHIPETVIVLTPEQLEQRQLTIHAATPLQSAADYHEMTVSEVTAVVQAWVVERA